MPGSSEGLLWAPPSARAWRRCRCRKHAGCLRSSLPEGERDRPRVTPGPPAGALCCDVVRACGHTRGQLREWGRIWRGQYLSLALKRGRVPQVEMEVGREGTVEGLARGPGNLQEEGASGERQLSWKVLRSAGPGLAPRAVRLSGMRCAMSDSQHSKTFQRKDCQGGPGHLPGTFRLSFVISGLHFAFR